MGEAAPFVLGNSLVAVSAGAHRFERILIMNSCVVHSVRNSIGLANYLYFDFFSGFVYKENLRLNQPCNSAVCEGHRFPKTVFVL